MRWFSCLLFALLIAGLALASPAGALDEVALEEIQQAIKQKGARWEAADNLLFRLDAEEQRLYLGANPPAPEVLSEDYGISDGAKKALPESFDWRNLDGVNWLTPIRNQGGCGSCVAFGAIAVFEGLINIYSGNPTQDLDLSEQHIFSCGGGSCSGGWDPVVSAQYLQDYGAPLEQCLPYGAVDNNCEETCSDWQQQTRKISEWGKILYGSSIVDRMKLRLMDGPLDVVFWVYEDFYAYSSGVYQYVWGQMLGGHCVALVGWDDADSCWIVKNSWGPGWGENGYFRIRMGHNEVDIEKFALWMVPEPVHSAYVQMKDYAILDQISGNGDGIPDASETFDFTVTLENPPTWGSLTDMSGWLLPEDPRATIIDVLGSYPSGLPGGSTATNDDDPFTIALREAVGITSIPFSLFITATCEGTFPYSTQFSFQIPLTVPQDGWPVETAAGVRCSPLMVWNPGGTRRLLATEDRGYVHMWDESGQELPGFPFYAPGGSVWGSVALGDLDGDGAEEILFGSKNDTLYALHSDGSLFFKLGMGADVLATPALGDLDGDGSLEIVLGTTDSQVHVLTSQGQKYSPFPIPLGGPVMADAALADLNDDGGLEVVVGASDGLLYVLSAETGEFLPGFPLATEGAIWSAPVIADLDGCGGKEIVVGSDDKKLYAVKSTGDLLFTAIVGQAIKSSPALADLDGNNKLDVIFTSTDGKVYAVNHRGYSLSGWPYDTGDVLWSSPIVLDIDGDGALEVMVETTGPQLIHLKANGSLLMALDIETSGLPMSTPVAGDLDCDGDLEVAVGAPRAVCVWNYPTASDVDMPWPMYRGNARRTGYIGDVTTERQEKPPTPSVPVDYALGQNYPNPFNPETTIRYSLAQEGPVRLSIFNVLGQEVVSLVNSRQTAGFHEVLWDGVDARGNHVSSGLYFYRLQAGTFAETRKMVLLR